MLRLCDRPIILKGRILCNDDGEFYAECVNRLFDNHKAACEAAYKCAKDEVDNLNEPYADEDELRENFFVEKCGNDEVSVYQRNDGNSHCTLVTRYNVHRITES